MAQPDQPRITDILALPIELVAHISTFVNHWDVLALRSASRRLRDGCWHTFADIYFSKVNIDLSSALFERLETISRHPQLGPAVKVLEVGTPGVDTYFPYHEARLGHDVDWKRRKPDEVVLDLDAIPAFACLCDILTNRLTNCRHLVVSKRSEDATVLSQPDVLYMFLSLIKARAPSALAISRFTYRATEHGLLEDNSDQFPVAELLGSPNFLHSWAAHLEELTIHQVDVVYPLPMQHAPLLELLPHARGLRGLCLRGSDFTRPLTRLFSQDSDPTLPPPPLALAELELDVFLHDVPNLEQVARVIHTLGASSLESLTLRDLRRAEDERSTDDPAVDDARIARVLRSFCDRHTLLLPMLRRFVLLAPLKPLSVPAQALGQASYPVFTEEQVRGYKGTIEVLISYDGFHIGAVYPQVNGLRYICTEDDGSRLDEYRGLNANGINSGIGAALEIVASLVPQLAPNGEVPQVPEDSGSWEDISHALEQRINPPGNGRMEQTFWHGEAETR